MSKAACLPLYLCHSVCVSYPGWSSVKTAKLIPGLFLLLVQRRRNDPLETRNRGSAFGKSEGTFTALTFLSAWKLTEHIQTGPAEKKEHKARTLDNIEVRYKVLRINCLLDSVGR